MTGYGKESARLYSKEPAVGYLARFVRPPQPRGVSMIANRPENGASTRGSADEVLAGARCGPTALRIALGAQLRRLREASGITTEEAAEAILATHSKISRLERGRTGAKQRDVADLLSLYGVTGETEREQMLMLARQAGTPGWWQQYSDVLPRWLELYVGLEEAASIIRTYEVQFVHGLMQTEDYARTVILIANAHAPAAEVDRRVSMRIRRQQRSPGPVPRNCGRCWTRRRSAGPSQART